MPTMVTGWKSHATAASTRRKTKSVECQTSMTCFFSDRPLRTVLSSARASGEPGSVSAGTHASSVKSRPASADAHVPCESAKYLESEKGSRGSAGPLKMVSKGSAGPPAPHPKTGPKGSAGPSKTGPKGPSKTAPSKDDSSSRGSPTGVRVEGVL